MAANRSLGSDLWVKNGQKGHNSDMAAKKRGCMIASMLSRYPVIAVPSYGSDLQYPISFDSDWLVIEKSEYIHHGCKHSSLPRQETEIRGFNRSHKFIIA